MTSSHPRAGSPRAALLRAVSRRLDGRRVVWAGIRGDDVEPLADLPELEAVFSIINEYARRPGIDAVSYEALSGVRVDLETWDIDEHLDAPETITFRRGLLQALSQRSVLLPYRPSRFLSAVAFARRDQCAHAGLFGGHQAAFDHKPWVESAVAELGLPHIPWTYVADEEQLSIRTRLTGGPVVLRRSRTSGGEGIRRVDDPADLAGQWPRGEEAFVSVAPFLEGGLPVNVGATVWHDGVTVHLPSVQLIGVPEAVTRPFGYCGNDFGRAAELDPEHVDQIERSTMTIGGWLRRHGYLGTFGVDFLIHGGQVLFTEVNPRFQGSTPASSQLDVEAGRPCLLLEHLAAFLGVEAPPQRPLRELVREGRPLAHVVVHWTGTSAHSLDPSSLQRWAVAEHPGGRADVLTRPELVTHPGAAVGRFTVREELTRSGYDLAEPWRAAITRWRHEQLGAPPVGGPAGIVPPDTTVSPAREA